MISSSMALVCKKKKKSWMWLSGSVPGDGVVVRSGGGVAGFVERSSML